VRRLGSGTLLALAVLAFIASVAGNITLFYLFGFALPVVILLAVGTTALPLVVGHIAYDKIVGSYKALQTILILCAAALAIVGLMQLGQARRAVLDVATSSERTNSYVDQGSGAPEDAT